MADAVRQPERIGTLARRARAMITSRVIETLGLHVVITFFSRPSPKAGRELQTVLDRITKDP